MRRTLTKSRKRKKTKAFNPQRDYLEEAVKDYLHRGGKITKIIEDAEEYDPFFRPLEKLPPAGGIMTDY